MKVLITEKLSPNKMKTPEGYLICRDAVIARTGAQEYMKCEIYPNTQDTTIIKLHRLPEDVFSPAAIASFENKPLTCEHPYENVNPENYRDLSVGFVRDVHRGTYDGQDVLLANLIITDSEIIEDIENGYRTELSCGYDCDITEGENPRQINIRGNHVALCEQGRAGIAKIIDSKKKINDAETFAAGSEYVTSYGYDIIIKEVKDLELICMVNGKEEILSKENFEDLLKKQVIKPVNRVSDAVEDTQIYDSSKYTLFKKDGIWMCTTTANYENGIYTGNEVSEYKNAVSVEQVIDYILSNNPELNREDISVVEETNEEGTIHATINEEKEAKAEVKDSIINENDNFDLNGIFIEHYKGINLYYSVEKDLCFGEFLNKMYTDKDYEELKKTIDEAISKNIDTYTKILDSVINYKEGYSKDFYKKLADQISENLKKIEENESIKDSEDEENYYIQKSNLSSELRRQKNLYEE